MYDALGIMHSSDPGMALLLQERYIVDRILSSLTFSPNVTGMDMFHYIPKGM